MFAAFPAIGPNLCATWCFSSCRSRLGPVVEHSASQMDYSRIPMSSLAATLSFVNLDCCQAFVDHVYFETSNRSTEITKT